MERSEFIKFVESIGKALGPEWTPKTWEEGSEPHYNWHELTKGGRSIHFEGCSSRTGGRLIIGGSWPHWNEIQQGERYPRTVSPRDVNEDSPSISVSPERSVEAIAKDITRRLLPEYDRIFALCLKKCEENERYNVAQHNSWLKLCNAAGESGAYKRDQFSLHKDGQYNDYVTFQKSGENSFRIQGYLTMEAALKLVKILKP